MKKIGVILIFAFAIFAFIGCGDEGTGLRWKNGGFDNSGENFAGIMWVPEGSAGVANQTWNGVPAQDGFTDSKEVTALSGKGEALAADGSPADVIFTLDSTDPDLAGVALYNPVSYNVVLKKNSDATLVIDATAKK